MFVCRCYTALCSQDAIPMEGAGTTGQGKLDVKAKNIEFGSSGFELPVLVPAGARLRWEFQVLGGNNDCKFALHEVGAAGPTASRVVLSEQVRMVKRAPGTCDEGTELRIQQLAAFYEQHNKHKKSSARDLLLNYSYRDLVLSLQSQYGALPSGWSSDPMWEEEWGTVKGSHAPSAGVSACLFRWEGGWLSARRLSYRIVLSDFDEAQHLGQARDGPPAPGSAARDDVTAEPAMAPAPASAVATASASDSAAPTEAATEPQTAASLAHRQRGAGQAARSMVLDPRDQFKKRIQIASAPTQLSVFFGEFPVAAPLV